MLRCFGVSGYERTAEYISGQAARIFQRFGEIFRDFEGFSAFRISPNGISHKLLGLFGKITFSAKKMEFSEWDRGSTSSNPYLPRSSTIF
jgi:hypothetical protein